MLVTAVPHRNNQTQDDSEGPVQMGHLDGLGELPPPARQEVVSPSQSAFGLRAYEDEGEAGEGEAPPEVAEEDYEDEENDDWDAVSVFSRSHRTRFCATWDEVLCSRPGGVRV